jgi:signal transduction histidine kinase
VIGGTLRQRLAAAQAADAMEFGQAKLRFRNQAVVFGYFMALFLFDGVLDGQEVRLVLVILAVLLVSAAHFGWIVARPGVNERRRCTAVVIDMAATALGMALTGESGVVLFVLFPWIVIGNGFRFGRWYLHYAQALSIVCFAIVLYVNDFWHQHAVFGAALMLVLVVLPVYESLLLAMLSAASERVRQASREAQAANAAKTRFLAAASHDLRQPMQALCMYTSVLEQRVSEADTRRVVRGVELSVRTLEQLFDSLLDISKIESGVIKPAVVEFPLAPLIEHVVETEASMAAHKKLELRWVRTSACVRSDPGLLERMLKNLVTNAIRYTERGRIVVGCRRSRAGRVRLEFVDSGIGIPGEEQERIFEEYYQVAGASALGLGLGLPIVKSLGELLGHPVALRSTPGRGSVFSIELPAATPQAGAVDAASSPGLALGGANVVLVDDDVEIRNSMQLLLEGWGCRYFGGATAAEVADKLRAERVVPDALIVDYRLADAMTGLQVIEQLRAAFGAKLPALLITGSPGAPTLRQKSVGIPFVTKPLSPGKLRAFLSHALQHA